MFARRGRAPVSDQEIFRDNRDLVEDEHRERVSAQKHAEDAADEDEVKREKFTDAVLDVPREKDADGGGETGEHEEREADTVGREVVANAEFGDPRRSMIVWSPGEGTNEDAASNVSAKDVSAVTRAIQRAAECERVPAASARRAPAKET